MNSNIEQSKISETTSTPSGTRVDESSERSIQPKKVDNSDSTSPCSTTCTNLDSMSPTSSNTRDAGPVPTSKYFVSTLTDIMRGNLKILLLSFLVYYFFLPYTGDFNLKILLLLSFLVYYFFGPYTGDFSDDQKLRYGEWAVVAGASEGLGAEWGHQLAAQNLNVLLIARREKELQEVADSIRSKYPSVEVDVLVMDLLKLTPEIIFEDIQKRNKRRIGLIVCNAMYTATGHFLDDNVSVEKLQKVINLNNNAMLELVHPLAKSMKKDGRGNLITDTHGGGVVLMSSMTGETGVTGFATYSASKSFLKVFARALQFELEPYKIDVLSCIAGATTTPNYLSARKGVFLFGYLIEQSPASVVSECISALGRTSAIATGFVNKLTRFVLTKMIPEEVATWVVSSCNKHQMDLTAPNRQDILNSQI